MAKPYDPKDFYYRKAKKEGLRARSAYKIAEILARHRLLGVVLLAASLLAFVAVRVAQRVAAEVEEDRRLLERAAAAEPPVPSRPP